MNLSFISGLNPHFIHPRSWRSSGTCSLHLRGGDGVYVAAFLRGKLSCINSVLVWWDKKDEVTHQSQVKPALAACIICTVQWSDRRSKGIKAVPEKMVCVGRLLGVTSPVLKLWFTSFPHRTAKERCSRSVHGGENGCRWKWGYSHLTLCLYLPSPSCRISFEIRRGRLVATSPQY